MPLIGDTDFFAGLNFWNRGVSSVFPSHFLGVFFSGDGLFVKNFKEFFGPSKDVFNFSSSSFIEFSCCFKKGIGDESDLFPLWKDGVIDGIPFKIADIITSFQFSEGNWLRNFEIVGWFTIKSIIQIISYLRI